VLARQPIRWTALAASVILTLILVGVGVTFDSIPARREEE